MPATAEKDNLNMSENSILEVIDLVTEGETDNSVILLDKEASDGSFFFIDSTPDYRFLNDKEESERFWQTPKRPPKKRKSTNLEQDAEVGSSGEKWKAIEDGEVWTEQNLLTSPPSKKARRKLERTEKKENNNKQKASSWVALKRRERRKTQRENKKSMVPEKSSDVIDLTSSDSDDDCKVVTRKALMGSPVAANGKKLRPIVVDGCNVAFGHGKDKFSSKGLARCIEYFEERGHTVTAFVPQFRRRHPQTLNPEILDRLEKRGALVFTPSRSVNGRLVVSYDDRFIVEYASKVGGVIISRDNYRDLLTENPNWADVINNRLLMYTWAKDTIMFPQDPLGRFGPNLMQFLTFDS